MIASIGQRGRKDGSRQTGMSSALAAQAARPGIQTPYGIMAAGELSTSARPKEHHHAHAPKAASIEPKMDGHDGRDGPRRDGLGTPCDAPRLTVLRASQQQECIDTSSSCKQICRNRASQPESSAAAQQRSSAAVVGVSPAAAGSALLSLQSYSSTTASTLLSPTRHEERRLVSTLRISHSGRPLATTIERVCVVARHTGGHYCCYCTQQSTGLRCQQKFVRDGVRQRSVLDMC